MEFFFLNTIWNWVSIEKITRSALKISENNVNSTLVKIETGSDSYVSRDFTISPQR